MDGGSAFAYGSPGWRHGGHGREDLSRNAAGMSDEAGEIETSWVDVPFVTVPLSALSEELVCILHVRSHVWSLY